MKHEWFRSNLGSFPGGLVICSVCLIVQNDKNIDKDCKGPTHIVFKNEPADKGGE